MWSSALMGTSTTKLPQERLREHGREEGRKPVRVKGSEGGYEIGSSKKMTGKLYP